MCFLRFMSRCTCQLSQSVGCRYVLSTGDPFESAFCEGCRYLFLSTQPQRVHEAGNVKHNETSNRVLENCFGWPSEIILFLSRLLSVKLLSSALYLRLSLGVKFRTLYVGGAQISYWVVRFILRSSILQSLYLPNS
jgi:hypothetical protein